MSGRIIIATSNAGKVIEIRSALKGPAGIGGIGGWSLEALPPGTPDVEETGNTFIENAVHKALHYSALSEHLTLADDSGLAVDALGGRPGIHSARYAENPEARIRRLLQEMESVEDTRRGATFYCALALTQRGNVLWTTQGEVSGRIARSPSGAEGFGYDPVFVLPERNQTMAELTTADKNRLSARGKALAQFRVYLRSLFPEKHP